MAGNECEQMPNIIALVLTLICLGGDLFLLDLFKTHVDDGTLRQSPRIEKPGPRLFWRTSQHQPATQ